jgi:hypothetical protein
MLALLLASAMLVVELAPVAVAAAQTTATKQDAERAARQAEQAAREAADAAAAAAAAEAQDESAFHYQKSQRRVAYEQRDFVIRLERTACFGPCPVYTITVLGDRSATFVATTMKSSSSSCCDLVKKKTLSTSDYDNLVKQIEAMDFFKLKERYSGEITDQPGVKISVIAPYGTHSVWRYAVPCATEYRKFTSTRKGLRDEPSPYDYLKGVTPPPDSLCKLESMIDQLTGAERWAKETTRH